VREAAEDGRCPSNGFARGDHLYTNEMSFVNTSSSLRASRRDLEGPGLGGNRRFPALEGSRFARQRIMKGRRNSSTGKEPGMAEPRPPERDRGGQDLISDPGNRDLDEDGFRRDFLGDRGVRDLVQDLWAGDSSDLGVAASGFHPDELVLSPSQFRSAARATGRKRA
jgi:hypothetical protein